MSQTTQSPKPQPARIYRGLKVLNVGGWAFYSDPARAIAPYFSNLIRQRLHKKMACNIIVTGEAGVSKSYTAIFMARVLDPRFRVVRTLRSGREVPQIVFDYSEYYDALLSLPMGSAIVFDEPSYALSAREWYNEINQALVKTIESQRFMVKPLIIPIINQNLIDKTIRSYLIQFHVHMTGRGEGRVYRLYPSQYESKLYRYFICTIKYGLMEASQCKKDCVGCSKLQTCDHFRAQYEKRKLERQRQRYLQDKTEAKTQETRRLTLEQIGEAAHNIRNRIIDSNLRIDATALRLLLREQGIVIGNNKSYDVKKWLEIKYPELYKTQAES